MNTIERLTDLRWKESWTEARQHHLEWWNHEGLVLWVTAPRKEPAEEIPPPPAPADLQERWFSPEWRLRQEAHRLAHTWFGGDAFPILPCFSAAGDLGAYVGCRVNLDPQTVWCEPCIPDPPEEYPPIRLNREAWAFRRHLQMARRAVRESRGR